MLYVHSINIVHSIKKNNGNMHFQVKYLRILN